MSPCARIALASVQIQLDSLSVHPTPPAFEPFTDPNAPAFLIALESPDPVLNYGVVRPHLPPLRQRQRTFGISTRLNSHAQDGIALEPRVA